MMPVRKSARAEVQLAIMPGDDPHAYAGNLTVNLTVLYPAVPDVTLQTILDAITEAVGKVAVDLVEQGISHGLTLEPSRAVDVACARPVSGHPGTACRFAVAHDGECEPFEGGR